jgi:hypothetical protein
MKVASACRENPRLQKIARIPLAAGRSRELRASAGGAYRTFIGALSGIEKDFPPVVHGSS